MARQLTTVPRHCVRLGLLAAIGLALAAPASGQEPSPAPAQAPSVSYPPSRSLADVFAWLRKDTPIAPAQVVDVSPSAITAVVSSSPTGQPRDFLATIASEAVNPEIVSHDGIASWSIPAEVDCDKRQVRLGAMTGFRSRDLRSQSKVLRAADTAFVVPTPTAPLGAVVRALCDRDFKRPAANAKGKASGQPPLVVAQAKPPVVVAPEKPKPPAPVAADPPASSPPAATDDAATAPKGSGPKTVEMKKPAEPKTIVMPGSSEPAEAAAKPKPKPKPKPPAGGGAFSLQLGASPTLADANLLIAKFKKTYGGSMGGLTLGVATPPLDGKAVNRVLLSGFASSVEANRFCEALQANKQPCFIRR